MTRGFFRHLTVFGTLVFSLACFAIALLYFAAVIQSQLSPGITIHSLSVDQVGVSTTHQLRVALDVSVRKGCTGKAARGYVRPTPGGGPNDMDIQVMTDASVPVGLTLADLGVQAPKLQTTSSQIDASHQTMHYQIFYPSPNTLESGGGWRFAEFLSQEGCGWLHGLLPITTTVAVGPPINLN